MRQMLLSLFVYVLIVPVTIFGAGKYIAKTSKTRVDDRILMAACAVFALSIFLPSPPIHGQDTQFMMHFFGGGVFTGLLWLYLRPLLGNRRWYLEILTLYVLVSALGVLNELYEIFIFETRISRQPITDTSYDLLANTLGVLIFYSAYRLMKIIQTLFTSR